MPGCIFCFITVGEIPAAVVFRDEQLVAFMDSSPIRRGHVQIVPREHFETFDVLPPELLNRMALLAQRLAARLKQMTSVERTPSCSPAATFRTPMPMCCRWSSRPTSRPASTFFRQSHSCRPRTSASHSTS